MNIHWFVSAPGYDYAGDCERCKGPVMVKQGEQPASPLLCVMCQIQELDEEMGLSGWNQEDTNA